MLSECFVVKTISYTTFEITTFNRKTRQVNTSVQTIAGKFSKKTNDEMLKEIGDELNSAEITVCDVVMKESRR